MICRGYLSLNLHTGDFLWHNEAGNHGCDDCESELCQISFCSAGRKDQSKNLHHLQVRNKYTLTGNKLMNCWFYNAVCAYDFATKFTDATVQSLEK